MRPADIPGFYRFFVKVVYAGHTMTFSRHIRQDEARRQALLLELCLTGLDGVSGIWIEGPSRPIPAAVVHGMN